MSSLDLDSTYGALLLGGKPLLTFNTSLHAAEMYQYLFQFCKSGSAAQDESNLSEASKESSQSKHTSITRHFPKIRAL
jgi:hypothetical protein